MANRYWVGGTGNWDASDTTHWSTSSGGTGGASVPTSSDNVIFDTSSSTANAAYTVTITATANCLDFTMDGPDPADATKVTWTGNGQLNIYGSMNLTGGTAGITRAGLFAIYFSATTTGKTIAFNGVVMTGEVRFVGVGGGWTLQDDMNLGANQFYHSNGTVDTNGKTVTCNSYSGNFSSTRALTLGTSIINCSTSFNLATSTGMTLNAGTSTINVTGSNASPFSGGGLTYYAVNINTSGSGTISGANTFTNLTRTGTAAKTDALTLSGNQTITGTLTINGNSSINRVFVKSNTIGTARTLTASTVSVTNADFQDITGAGAGSWDLSAITGLSGDCGGNSGITFTSPTTTTCSAGTTWSTATWSVRVPLPQDTATFSGSSRTITQDIPRVGGIDFTGSSGLTLSSSTSFSIFGSLNLTNLGTLSASGNTITFSGRGSFSLTSASKSISYSIDINCPGGTLSLQDNFIQIANNLTFTNGTFDANGKNLQFVNCFPGTGTKTVNMGSGTWEFVTGSGNWGFNGGTAGLTVNAQTSTFKFTGTGSATFNGGGFTYNNFWNATTSTAVITISGSNTFNDFKSDVGRTNKFTAGTIQHVTTFTVNGTAGNEVVLDSTTTGTYALVKDGGGTITCDYLNIQHCVATPTLTWLATNSTNNQATATAGSGWYFGSFPVGNSNFFMFF